MSLIMFNLLHLHIPKTAGTSLLELYKLHFGDSAVLSIKREIFKNHPGVPAHSLIKDQLNPSIQVLHGHLYWEEVEPLLKSSDRLKIVTFLRNPVDRVISNYFFFKKRILKGKVPDHQRHRLNEGLLDYAALPESRNRMSGFLKGLELERLFFCGTLEHFDSDIHQFAQLMGWSLDQIPEANKNDSFEMEKSEISSYQIQQLAELNAEDMKLYEKAIQLHNRQNKMEL